MKLCQNVHGHWMPGNVVALWSLHYVVQTTRVGMTLDGPPWSCARPSSSLRDVRAIVYGNLSFCNARCVLFSVSSKLCEVCVVIRRMLESEKRRERCGERFRIRESRTWLVTSLEHGIQWKFISSIKRPRISIPSMTQCWSYIMPNSTVTSLKINLISTDTWKDMCHCLHKLNT